MISLGIIEWVRASLFEREVDMKLFNKFPFIDKPNTATFTCVHVINKEKNILYVIHDEDVFWQFLCGDNHSDEEARIVSLEEIYI